MCSEFVKIKCCDHYRENMRSDTHTQTHHTRDSKLSTAVACPLILDENTSNAAFDSLALCWIRYKQQTTLGSN